MKSLTKKVIFILSFLFLSFGGKQLFAIECPPANDTTNCSPWLSMEFTDTLTKYGSVEASVYYRVRWCNGERQYIIDSMKALDNGQYMDTFKIFQYDFSSFRDLVDIHIIEHSDLQTDIPFCPDSLKIVKVYSAACGVWVKCSYIVDPASRQCDIGYIPPYPDYPGGPDTTWVDVWKWQSCGEVCCEKIYTVCKEHNLTHGMDIIKIKNLHKQRYPMTPKCTLEGQFKDWRPPNNAYACQDGC